MKGEGAVDDDKVHGIMDLTVSKDLQMCALSVVSSTAQPVY